MRAPASNLLIHNFISSVRKNPHAPALDVNNKSYTYNELFKSALKIAGGIKKSGTSELIAVFSGKDIFAYSAILATLLAGAGYVPLNKKFPAGRNVSMFNQSGCKIIITGLDNLMELKEILSLIEEKITVIIPGTERKSTIEKSLAPHTAVFTDVEETDGSVCNEFGDDGGKIAYLLFTSGSSGEPKGVAVSNKNVLTYINNFGHYSFSATDRFSQTFDLTFDLSVHDMFICWSAGSCLVVPPEDMSPVLFSSFINEKNITCWFSVPSAAMLLMKARLLKPASFSSLKYSFFCGEGLPEKVAEQWQLAAQNSKLINLYGPTETTIAVSSYEWRPNEEENNCLNGIVPIGRIFGDHKYLLVDENLKSEEKTGELMISGNQVASGYLNNEMATNTQFVWINDHRWYKTGDLVTKDEDGILHFLGRSDNQVKINGYRVELSEIDHNIRRMVNTPLVATLLDPITSQLVSFVSKEPGLPDENTILNYCKRNLPPYMIPEKILFIDKMPFNLNGKIDRKQLLKSLR